MGSTPKAKLFFILLVLGACLPQNTMLVTGGVVKRSDDVSIPELHTLVQQQAAVISSLQASLTSMQNAQNTMQNIMQNKFTELESKVGTLSKAVAFSAMFSTDDNGDNGVPLSLHSILQFDRVVTNAGNGYNPANGIFTAPVSGYYAFSIVMMEPNSSNHPDLSISIVKNGVVMDQAYVHNTPADLSEQGSTYTVLHLAVGEQVWIRQESGDAVRGSYWTVFTGYLVHAD